MTTGSFAVSVSGVAVVCCVHDRQKDLVKDPDVLIAAATRRGINRNTYLVQFCACCRNYFLHLDDEPALCQTCRRRPVHQPAGPLPNPEGIAA